MTEPEWGEFWKMLDDLYPGKLNPAQAAVWKSRVLGLPLTEAQAALNDYYSGEKKPRDGAVPSIHGFLRKVRAESEERAIRKGSETSQPWHEILRATWKHAHPGKAHEYDAMDEDTILLTQAHWEYEQCVSVYGKHARASASSYWKWQQRLYKMGERDTYPGVEPGADWWKCKTRWSWGAHILYLEEVDEHDEAQRVKAEYKRVARLAGGSDHRHGAVATSVAVPQP